MSDNQKPQDEAGPEEAFKGNWKAIPEPEDTEGHAIRVGRGGIAGADEPGPEGGIKWRGAVPDEGKDAEGHAIRPWKAIPDADEPGPDGTKGDQPGADEAVRRS